MTGTKLRIVVQFLYGGGLGFGVPWVNCSSVVPGCLLCIMLKTDFIPKALSSKVPPLFIYPDLDSRSGTVFKWEQCIILDCSCDK